MNEASSRSHCVVTITVERRGGGGGGAVALGRLRMVDLAGR